MNLKNLTLGLAICTLLIAEGCVPHRKYNDALAAKEAIQQENESLRGAKEQAQSSNKELNSTIETLNKSITELAHDTARLGAQYRQIRIQYDKINELNDILSNQTNQLLGQAAGQNKKLTDDLNKAQEALQIREDAVKELEKSLNEKQTAIDAANALLTEKQARLESLEKLLEEQQAASDALRNKVHNALLGFQDKGLSVTQKDGKVYVSMEAKLLFASGSTAVDPNGKKAVIDLAKAIEGESDMEIIVEGHTDTDKLNSKTSPKDNWELSVLRATEVVKIMTSNSSLSPTVISAAGRSEYHPVSDTDKSKNRRIEIILQPKLNELYRLIENK